MRVEHNDHQELMRVINHCARLLLEVDIENQMQAMVQGMKLIGNTVDVDRVTVWQNHFKDERLYYKLVCEWANDNLDSLDKESMFAYEEIMPTWEDKFTRGISVNGPIDTLPDAEYKQLEIFGLQSILAVPIFYKDQLWGFVSFDDYRNKHFFRDGEANVLHSWGLLVVSALQRRDIHLKMQQTLIDLEIALDNAQAASLAKTAFLANMSHEIRTPINAIVGMTNIGKTSDDIERKDYCFTKIEDASSHLLGVINDILDMSKIEANKFELSLTPFELDKVIQRVINVVNFRVDEKKQKLTLQIDNNIPSTLIGDDQRLLQIITNLIGNAIKFTPDKGKIHLDARLLDEKNGICTIQISVSDSGIGISPEQQTGLFQTFQQAESSTTRKYGGTGLGLPISKSLVEMMNGEIHVDSEPGIGSTFTFTVQLKRSKQQEQDINYDKTNTTGRSGDIKNHLPGDTNNIFAGCNLLLAEDVDINREIVLALLEPTKILIDCAENGNIAVQMFKSKPDGYDLIFMDLQMPEMDGYDATKAIRALDIGNAKTIPIVAMTANVFREDIDRCLSAGMNGHIGKPLDFDEVISILRDYLL